MPMPEILLEKRSFHSTLSERDDEEKSRTGGRCVSEEKIFPTRLTSCLEDSKPRLFREESNFPMINNIKES